MSKQHKISADVRADIIRRVKEEGVPVSQAATEHGVHESTIYNWLGGGAKGAPSWSEFARIRREKEELLKIVGELTVQLSVTQKKSW